MRYLFVYQDFADKTRNLVQSLGADDVVVIVVRKNEDYPSANEIQAIGGDRPAAAICQVVRKYKKNIASLVDIEYEAKSFREEDQQLKEWLLPARADEEAPSAPSVAFAAAMEGCADFLIATNALARIDEIHPRRWGFVSRAAKLLRRHADKEALCPMRDWEAQHDVEFAANGRVSFRCYLPGKKQPSSESYWHLKDGDKTSADDAPRIYFNVLEVNDRERVVVTYAGPHPKDGDYTVSVE